MKQGRFNRTAHKHGVAQYVVLGAGLDTFAYRNPYLTLLRAFEVDHPATQAWKLERLQTASIALPSSGLEQGGFDSGSPAFFSWLGVTPYLTRESRMATLRFIAQLPPGSGVAFDFAVDPNYSTCDNDLPCSRYRGGWRSGESPFNSSSVPPNLRRN